MKCTISDIARLAQVSKATVSRVINNKSQGVGPDTKERILKIIQEIGYLPNTLARSIVVSETKTLGLVIPDITNPFFPQMVRGIVRYANECGYTVFLCNADNDSEKEEKYVMSLIEKRIDGVILASSADFGSNSLSNLKHYDVPVVQVDRIVGGNDAGASVSIDNRGGTYNATRRFLQAGHKRIAFLGGSKGVSTTVQRLRGYRDALEDAGLEQDKDLILFGDYSIQSGMAMAQELLTRSTKVTAIIGGCDLIAIGAVKALVRSGIRVPEECEIIGFDGIEMGDIFDPPISTVAQPIGEMAEEAAKLLIGIINGTISSNRHIVIEPSLVLRKTTK